MIPTYVTLRRLFIAIAVFCLAALLQAPAASAASAPHGGIWLRVDTVAEITEIWRGERRLLVLEDIAFGRGGISDLHFRGDQTTPRGEYRITRFNPESRFHRFIGINYPTLDHLDEARRAGALSDHEYRRALEQGLRNGEFPQNGTLGGYIGFHGIGDGDPDIHQAFHWTEGCIAMTNAQIETLRSWVTIGTPVVIE